MKVLQINTVCGITSTGKIAIDLYRVLEEQGHECVIAFGRGRAPSDIKTIKIGSDIDNYIHGFKTRVFDKHCFGSTKATKEFIKEIEKYNPDIIHLHNIHGYYINIEVLFNYLREINKPVVWTLHDCWPFTGHCAYFDYIDCDKWKTDCYNCPQKKEYPSSLFQDSSKCNYEKKKEFFTSVKNITIVTPSNWLFKVVKKSFLSKYTVSVINNGIDLQVFKPTKSKFRENYNLQDKFIILGVASVWTQRKGFEYFIELAQRLDKSYQVVLVGLTEKQKKKLPKSILGITRTSNAQELAAIYAAADIFVNPTLEDNFPTTNLEALACGTPVITFNTGGSVECIDDKCGVIVEKANIKMLMNAIENLKKRNLYEENCVEKAKLYDKYCRYLDYINKYKELLILTD